MSLVRKLLRSKLVQNGMWMLILQIFNTILPILTIPYITRVLSKTAYGEFAIASSWITYFQVVVEYGFALTGAKKAAMRKSDDELSDIRNSIISARLFLFAICFVFALIMLIFVPADKSLKVCFVILFTMVFSLVFQHNWFFQGIMEMRTLSIISVCSRLFTTILVFVFVNDTSDVYLYCLITASGTILTSIIGCIVANAKHSLKFRIRGIVNIFAELKDGWALFVSSAIGSVFGSVGITILGILASNADVAVYSAINKISYIIIILFTAVSQTPYPRSCKAFTKSFEYAVKDIKRIAVPVISLFGLLLFVICLFNRTIVKIAFGTEYAQHSFLVLPFAMWNLLGIINNFLGIQILVASGHKKEYSNSFVLSIIMMIILMFVFGYYWKSFGVSVALVCSEFLLTFILIYHVSRIKLEC